MMMLNAHSSRLTSNHIHQRVYMYVFDGMRFMLGCQVLQSDVHITMLYRNLVEYVNLVGQDRMCRRWTVVGKSRDAASMCRISIFAQNLIKLPNPNAVLSLFAWLVECSNRIVDDSNTYTRTPSVVGFGAVAVKNVWWKINQTLGK